MVGAGTDTTAGTLCVGTWMLLNDNEALQNLNHELRTVMPDKDSPVDLITVEGLPFLVSCLANPLTTLLPMKHGSLLMFAFHSVASSKNPSASSMVLQEDYLE